MQLIYLCGWKILITFDKQVEIVYGESKPFLNFVGWHFFTAIYLIETLFWSVKNVKRENLLGLFYFLVKRIIGFKRFDTRQNW